MKKIAFSFTTMALVFAVLATAAFAQVLVLRANPFNYDPDKTYTVNGDWISRIGLEDAFEDRHFGLLLSKNTATATNAAAGATIKDVNGITLTELGYDMRNGGHCGAGAPRFNVVTSDNVTHFVGCVYMTSTPDTPVQGWSRKRMTAADLQNPAKTFPPLQPTDTVKSIDIVFDEGTDIGPDFTGLAILDNIDVNGVLITRSGYTDGSSLGN